jgi:hypothetical protein
MVTEATATRKIKIPPAVWQCPLRGEVKNVLLQLWRFAPYSAREGEALFVYPKPDTLAAELHTTTRSVYRSLAKLIAHGYLERATQTVVRHAKGEPDHTVTRAGFVLFEAPCGRKETVGDEEIETALQLDLWSAGDASDRSVSDLGPKCHSTSFSDLRSDRDDFVVSARAQAPACVAQGVPTNDDGRDDDGDGTGTTTDDDDGETSSKAPAATRATSPVAGTTTTTEQGGREHDASLRQPEPTATARAHTSAPDETTPPPSGGRPPPYLHRPLALWERHEKLRCGAKVGGAHRNPPGRAALEAVVRLRDHVRSKLDCDEETAWRALDCYVRGAVRLVVEARDANRTCTPMLDAARSDGREWDIGRFDKTWPHVERVEWKADTAARMVEAEKARTEALIAERRAWDADPDRLSADAMREVAKSVLGPMGLNRWRIGVAAGAVSHEVTP